MPKKRSPIEQRKEQIAAQVERLRRQLASKTRKDYSSDFHYERCLGQSRELLDELLAELSILDDPGEYEQLPAAVVAEELGTTTSRVRLLIKGGEILASGKPAHEYVSREELGAASEAGIKELLRRLEQEAAEVFEESIEYLREGQQDSADKACRRLIARESIAGAFALPYETALFLARADLEEVDARLIFIMRAGDAEKARFIHNLRRLLPGMSFQDEPAMAIAERILHGDEAHGLGGHKVFGSKLDELQQLAMFITTVACDEIDHRWKRRLRASQREDLREIIQTAVYSSLYAHESYGRLASSREFVDAIRVLMPRYYQPARLMDILVRDKDS